MLRFFAPRAAQKLALSSEMVCKALGVESIPGPLKVVINPKPGEKGVVAADKIRQFSGRAATKEEIEENYKGLEEARRHASYY